MDGYFFDLIRETAATLGCTVAELCARSGYKEAQFYRWKNQGRVPKEAALRFAAALARLEDETKADPPHDRFPGTDKLDNTVNALLSAAGYKAITGAGENLLWYKVARERAWTLGYTDVGGWIGQPVKKGAEPKGKVVTYAKMVGGLLGLRTNWKYAKSWSPLLAMLGDRTIHAIAPFAMDAPERMFSCLFSDQCSEEERGIAGVGPKKLLQLGVTSMHDLPRGSKVRVTFVEDEIGHTAAELIDDVDDADKVAVETVEDAIANVERSSRGEHEFCIFLSEKTTCESIAQQLGMHLIEVPAAAKLRTHVAFAFHLDEFQLYSVTNRAIRLLSQDPPTWVDTLTHEAAR